MRFTLLLTALLLGACVHPPVHMTRIWADGYHGQPMLGLSTEDGVLLLVEPEHAVGDVLKLQFPVGNSLVEDWAVIDRRNDDLAIARPLSSNLEEGRFATERPSLDETIYLALRDGDDDPRLVEVRLWHDGLHGNWIAAFDGDPEAAAARWAGAGLYVHRGSRWAMLGGPWNWRRHDRWEIVGMLAGVTAHRPEDPDDVALGFVGLGEIGRLLPDRVDYFEDEDQPPRPDFEYGVPLQSGDLEADALLEQEAAEAEDGASDGGA